MGSLRIHAESELALIGYDENCEGINASMRNAVLQLIDTFASQGHSGMSASECLRLFGKLAHYEPISPLTCQDEEWIDVSEHSDSPWFQNKRNSAVFKEGKEGKPYFLDAIVWDCDGDAFTGEVEGITSSQYIRLPFTEKRFCVRIDSERRIIDRDELQKALEYYDYHSGVFVEITNKQ